MPVCVACGEWGLGPICLSCRQRLRVGGRGVFSALDVRYALHHSGTGRVLVHRLKYHGLVSAAEVLAAMVAPLVPESAAVLVPVPRAGLRRIAYGVDPAWELARRVGRNLRLPVAKALVAPLWWPRHATATRQNRRPPSFALRRKIVGPIVLIDDVVTTGATLLGAAAALGIEKGDKISAVAATSPGMMSTSKAPIASRRLRDGQTARQRPVEIRP